MKNSIDYLQQLKRWIEITDGQPYFYRGIRRSYDGSGIYSDEDPDPDPTGPSY